MVNHELLFRKLYIIRVRYVPHDWIVLYLTHRTQITVIQLQSNAVDQGVSQGSILGPILFIIFSNDICSTCEMLDNMILYADDTNVLITHNNLEDLLHLRNQASKELIEYCNNNALLCNFRKTTFLNFISKNSTPNQNVFNNLHTSGENLEYNKIVRFLGEKLTWEAHIDILWTKLSVCNLRSTKSTEVLKLVYCGLIRSRLRYGLLF